MKKVEKDGRSTPLIPPHLATLQCQLKILTKTGTADVNGLQLRAVLDGENRIHLDITQPKEAVFIDANGLEELEIVSEELAGVEKATLFNVQ